MPALTRSSQILTVATASAEFTNGMQEGQSYALISTTDCWFRIAATGTDAAAAADNVFLPAGVYVEIKPDSATIAFVSVIRATADGTANLILLEG